MTVASQVNQTIANLKGIQGTLRIYSIQAQDSEARLVFKGALETTKQVIDDLEIRAQELVQQEPQYKSN